MAELVRGQISDRPWGLTFGQFGLREITGQLTVHASDGRDYRVAFAHGAIVGASSPQSADAATRIAMTSGLITSTQVATVAKQIAATPEIDEIALLASAARLQVEQIAALRRKVISQRAARTFSIEAGSFVVDDTTTIPIAPDAAVDMRAVILQGARMNLAELRLVTELRELGSHFTLGETALEHAPWFGIESAELPILEALKGGASLPEIEARHREIDPRTVQAVVYALVACRECQVSTPMLTRPKTTSTEPVSVSFTRKPTGDHAIPTSLGPAVARTATPRPATAPVVTPAEQEFRGAVGTNTKPRKAYDDDSTALPPRTAASSIPPPITEKKSPSGGWPSVKPRDNPPSTPPVITPRTISQGNVTVSRTSSNKIEKPRTISEGAPKPRMVSEGVAKPRTVSDGVAKPRTISNPLTPPRTVSGGVATPRTISQSGGTPGAVYSEGSDRVSQSLEEAAEAFRRGVEALQANQLPTAVTELSRASTLNPHEFEHTALLAFAQLLSASTSERTKLADKTRKMMTHASQKSRDPAQALVYLGQLEQALGNDKQAVVHYRAALAANAAHPMALAGIQAIEEKALEKSGFNLFKKK